MISRLIRESFKAPLLTTLLIGAGATIGAFWMQDLRRDVFPDLAAPVFNVITQNPAMGAEELETAIAIPVEAALAGLPDVRRVRSSSQLGVAQVTIEFDVDSQAAMPQRRKAYADAAKRGYYAAVAHVSFPGIGRLRRDGKGYRWLPANYTANNPPPAATPGK